VAAATVHAALALSQQQQRALRGAAQTAVVWSVCLSGTWLLFIISLDGSKPWQWLQSSIHPSV